MALIIKVVKENRNSRLHDSVEATYNLVNGNGETYIQINTFGSNSRDMKGKVSQSIQLSKDVLKELIEVMENE